MPILTHPLHRTLFFVGSVLLLLLIEWQVIHSVPFGRHPGPLSLAVLFDLSVIPAGLFYWLLARPNNWPVWRTGLVLLLALRLSIGLLPVQSLPATLNAGLLFALIEGIGLLTVLVRGGVIYRHYRQARLVAPPDVARQRALESVLGQPMAGLLLHEAQLIRYALLGWRLTTDLPADATPLTTHRQSGQLALLVTLGVVALIECAGMHLLLARWNADVALWVSGLSLYGLLMLVSEGVATVKRPSYLTAGQLHLRLGMRWHTIIDRTQIRQVRTLSDKMPKRPGRLNAAFLTTPNVLLVFHQPITIQGMYGTKRTVDQLTLWLDGGVNELF